MCDVWLSTIGGFRSNASSEAVAQTLVTCIHGDIQGNSAKSIPVLNFECLFVKKRQVDCLAPVNA